MKHKVPFSGTREQLKICEDVLKERREQDRTWGQVGGPDDFETRRSRLVHIRGAAQIACRVVGRAQEPVDLVEYRRQLVLLAALALAAIEAHDLDMRSEP